MPGLEKEQIGKDRASRLNAPGPCLRSSVAFGRRGVGHEGPAANEVQYAQLAFGSNRSSKGRPGIVLKGKARMILKMVCKAFLVLDNDSAFRAGSQITTSWSGRHQAFGQDMRYLESSWRLRRRHRRAAAQLECSAT
jgi:hypothetical protein